MQYKAPRKKALQNGFPGNSDHEVGDSAAILCELAGVMHGDITQVPRCSTAGPLRET